LSSIVIDISELRKMDSEEIGELEKFLKEKLKADVKAADREITVKPAKKDEPLKKDHLRVLLKKYLHKAKLKEDFRVIAGPENTLIIKERKVAGEAE
jgi:primosomal protein N''